MSDAWDGRPQNPERDGWHWVRWAEYEPGTEFTAFWSSGEWSDDWAHLAGNRHARRYIYLGPCLTPAEAAAQAEAARREALAEWRDEPPGGISKGDVLYLSPERVAAQIETARREEREANARIAEGRVYKEQYRTWPWWINRDGSEGNRSADSDIVQHADKIAAAIRARGDA